MLFKQENPHSDDLKAQTEDKTCCHCGLASKRPFYLPEDQEKEKPFCCYGCLSVYQILHLKGLDHFYQIKKDMGETRDAGPAEISKEAFQYLDDPQFLEDFAEDRESGEKTLFFYLEGVHCVACLWLVEKLPEYCAEVQSAQLNLETSVVRIIAKKDGRFSEAARQLNSFGLRPSPLKKGEGHEKYLKKEERKELIRIGVAGAAAMNIMLYSISIYAGAPQSFSFIFSYIILAFSLPVVTYCSLPFYQNAWRSLKYRKLSLDLPISIALIYGSLRGLSEVLSGGTQYYFDTLTILVFLLLLSRYTVKKWGQKGLALNSLSSFISESSVQVWQNNQWREKHPDYLQQGELIKIRPQQTLPADGVIVEEQRPIYLQTSMLTGEAAPQKKLLNDKLLAGSQNVGAEFTYQLNTTKRESTLGQLLKKLELELKSKTFYSSLADKVSSRLVLIVLFLASAIALYFTLQGNFSEGERRALSLIIITCPCALGLSTPLALSRSINLASKYGIVLKNENLLERVSQIKTVLLDKTGTLTEGQFNLLEKSYLDHQKEDFFDSIVLGLEQNSSHPIAKGLTQGLSGSPASLKNVIETLGQGIQGSLEDETYTIAESKKYPSDISVKSLSLYQGETEVAHYKLGDPLRKEAHPILKKWSEKGFSFLVVSGDSDSRVKNLAEKLPLKKDFLYSKMLPQDKAELVSKLSPAMMIGDGANDSLALKKADVSIAVKGSMELALKSCDVYFSKPGLRPLDALFEISHSCVSLIRRNLKISIVYNSVGITLALLGYITPLYAAILMPLSSLTVVFSTLIGTGFNSKGALWTS